MTLLLFLWSSLGQLPMCQTISDCHIGEYCDNTFSCSICNYVTPETCDALRVECCSEQFLKHCVTNPHECPPRPVTTVTNRGLFMFNVVFSVSTIAYLVIGSYINKYQKMKKGLPILPNYNSWSGLIGLVKDGIRFTHVKMGRVRLGRLRLGRRMAYDSLE